MLDVYEQSGNGQITTKACTLKFEQLLRKTYYGCKSMSYIIPMLSNNLPEDVKLTNNMKLKATFRSDKK